MIRLSLLVAWTAFALAASGCESDTPGTDMDSGAEDSDASMADAATNEDASGSDAGPDTSCNIGAACTASPDSCGANSTCDEAFQYGDNVFPGESAPIRDSLMDLPMGETFSYASSPGNRCSLDGENQTALRCNRDMGCGPCARCLQGRFGITCEVECDPSEPDNDICRDGYRCDAATHTCQPGCTTDADCRVELRDTNLDGTLELPPGDEFRYDTSSTATCNMTSFECEHPSPSAADGFAGSPCNTASECEANGVCLPNLTFGYEAPLAEIRLWPNGYCTRFGCDVTSCGDEGTTTTCSSRPFGQPACFESCEVAWGVSQSNASTWFGASASGGCRTGYACTWDGTSGPSSTNGVCIGGNFNVRDEEDYNIGESCSAFSLSDCVSPLGLGTCHRYFLETARVDKCTILDCAAPDMPAGICGASAICADIDGPSGSLTACVETCTDPTDCASPFGCLEGGCVPYCTADFHCRDDESCVGAESGFGLCTPAA